MRRNLVHQIRLTNGITIRELLTQMEKTGVLGAGTVGKATSLLTKMFMSEKYTVFLSLAGPLVPSGLRHIISDLIKEGRIHVLISNGANIVHDIIEAFGHSHIKGSFSADDNKLRQLGIGRIGNVFVSEAAFKELETRTYEILETIPQLKSGMAPSIMLKEFGMKLKDKNSILYQAARKDVPIFAPGLLDSMLGLHLWMKSQDSDVKLDFIKDMHLLSDIVFNSTKLGAIMLGGGLPKHYTLASTILREGLDIAIQITTAPMHDGSLSGAPLEEGISWKKVKPRGSYVTIRGDATIIFPLIIAASLYNNSKKR